MKKPILPPAVGLLWIVSGFAQAATLALWTFEASVPASSGPHTAEAGEFATTSFATGSHVSTTYSNPVGNGSTESFSSNNWSVGDYYQFQTSTLGYESISVSFHQTRSTTGPASFTLAWSVNGTDFTPFGSYLVPVVTWSSGGSPNSDSIFPFALAVVSALSNANEVYFRLISNDVSTTTGGSNRVDNFIVSGDLIPAAPIPEPAHSFVGLLLAGGVMIRRRVPAKAKCI